MVRWLLSASLPTAVGTPTKMLLRVQKCVPQCTRRSLVGTRAAPVWTHASGALCSHFMQLPCEWRQLGLATGGPALFCDDLPVIV